MKLYTKKYSENVGGTFGYAGYRNRRRLEVLKKLIAVTGKDKILEIGPNTCSLLDGLKAQASSVLGIDINEELTRETDRSDFICMDATQMAFKEASFTTVIAIEVFEHIPALQKVFSEIDRVLVEGGKCYMTVPFELFRVNKRLVTRGSSIATWQWPCNYMYISSTQRKLKN